MSILGKGGLATVVKISDEYALKILSESRAADEEAVILETLGLNSTVVGFYGRLGEDCGAGSRNAALLLELCQGSVGDLLSRLAGQQYIVMMINCVAQLHSRGVIHQVGGKREGENSPQDVTRRPSERNSLALQDIKPSNFLFGRDGSVKLCDFNLSRMASDPTRPASGGTLLYFSPQKFSNIDDGYAADWWALGVTLYQLLYGLQTWPFSSRSLQRLGKLVPEQQLMLVRKAVMKGDIKFRALSLGLPRAARTLIRGLLHPQPELRWSLLHVLGGDYPTDQAFSAVALRYPHLAHDMEKLLQQQQQQQQEQQQQQQAPLWAPPWRFDLIGPSSGVGGRRGKRAEEAPLRQAGGSCRPLLALGSCLMAPRTNDHNYPRNYYHHHHGHDRCRQDSATANPITTTTSTILANLNTNINNNTTTTTTTTNNNNSTNSNSNNNRSSTSDNQHLRRSCSSQTMAACLPLSSVLPPPPPPPPKRPLGPLDDLYPADQLQTAANANEQQQQQQLLPPYRSPSLAPRDINAAPPAPSPPPATAATAAATAGVPLQPFPVCFGGAGAMCFGGAGVRSTAAATAAAGELCSVGGGGLPPTSHTDAAAAAATFGSTSPLCPTPSPPKMQHPPFLSRCRGRVDRGGCGGATAEAFQPEEQDEELVEGFAEAAAGRSRLFVNVLDRRDACSGGVGRSGGGGVGSGRGSCGGGGGVSGGRCLAGAIFSAAAVRKALQPPRSDTEVRAAAAAAAATAAATAAAPSSLASTLLTPDGRLVAAAFVPCEIRTHAADLEAVVCQALLLASSNGPTELSVTAAAAAAGGAAGALAVHSRLRVLGGGTGGGPSYAAAQARRSEGGGQIQGVEVLEEMRLMLECRRLKSRCASATTTCGTNNHYRNQDNNNNNNNNNNINNSFGRNGSSNSDNNNNFKKDSRGISHSSSLLNNKDTGGSTSSQVVRSYSPLPYAVAPLPGSGTTATDTTCRYRMRADEEETATVLKLTPPAAEAATAAEAAAAAVAATAAEAATAAGFGSTPRGTVGGLQIVAAAAAAAAATAAMAAATNRPARGVATHHKSVSMGGGTGGGEVAAVARRRPASSSVGGEMELELLAEAAVAAATSYGTDERLRARSRLHLPAPRAVTARPISRLHTDCSSATASNRFHRRSSGGSSSGGSSSGGSSPVQLSPRCGTQQGAAGRVLPFSPSPSHSHSFLSAAVPKAPPPRAAAVPWEEGERAPCEGSSNSSSSIRRAAPGCEWGSPRAVARRPVAGAGGVGGESAAAAAVVWERGGSSANGAIRQRVQVWVPGSGDGDGGDGDGARRADEVARVAASLVPYTSSNPVPGFEFSASASGGGMSASRNSSFAAPAAGATAKAAAVAGAASAAAAAAAVAVAEAEAVATVVVAVFSLGGMDAKRNEEMAAEWRGPSLFPAGGLRRVSAPEAVLVVVASPAAQQWRRAVTASTTTTTTTTAIATVAAATVSTSPASSPASRGLTSRGGGLVRSSRSRGGGSPATTALPASLGPLPPGAAVVKDGRGGDGQVLRGGGLGTAVGAAARDRSPTPTAELGDGGGGEEGCERKAAVLRRAVETARSYGGAGRRGLGLGGNSSSISINSSNGNGNGGYGSGGRGGSGGGVSGGGGFASLRGTLSAGGGSGSTPSGSSSANRLWSSQKRMSSRRAVKQGVA
ncbi:hypothetical protein VOLCADRAFT_118439 [Volvox carteri f. nagariensis]|uniref:Protein kinase domain-containing protein n=1 Tax=Volvox carteri f. nagariensis TaxID=3068 RepID=D8U4V5_VOLCA|nr:uncharacterized protein VOLCADRAFT_118439 [Volvox carteri f. nagariensis]EFJ45340.1 hypothetical protein VOLCADRAFT_118439 [Volvox carteri f. nagariensis]|eukprot:XP_002953716.1 hypothetical protein VOLCADRAFT_118439 [Volvox carteri f. nagariensis]